MMVSLCSVVVASPANVGVPERCLALGVLRTVLVRGAIEPLLEDRGDGGVGGRADVVAAPARRFEPLRPIAFHQAQDAETGAETLLRMRLGFHDRFDERDRGWSDLG